MGNINKILKKLFLKAGVYAVIRKIYPNKSTAILRYHAVVADKDNNYTFPGIVLSPEEFRKQVEYLSKNYSIISLDQFIDFAKTSSSLPPNSVVFTFDDGYADNFEAAKILHEFGSTGTFYLTVEAVDRKTRFWLSEVVYLIRNAPAGNFRIGVDTYEQEFHLSDLESRHNAAYEIVRIIKTHNRGFRTRVLKQLWNQLGRPEQASQIEQLMLNWKQVGKMCEWGMSIGSHTLSHLNLPNADPDDARSEITDSKIFLEKKIKLPVNHFSYPNSGPYEYFDNRIRQYVQKAGYESSTTSQNGFAEPQDDRFTLKRIRTVPELAEIVHQLEWDRLF